MGLSRSLPNALLAAIAGLSIAAPAAAAPVTATTAPAEAAPSVLRMADTDEYTFTGHGWGHGRGMGQYGALGYAVDHHWMYTQILDHYYGGTVMGRVPNFSPVSVELEALTGAGEVRVVGRGLVIDGVVQPDANADGSAVRVTPTAGGYVVQTGPGCGGPWATVKSGARVDVRTANPGTYAGLVRVCETGGERGYRGYLTVQPHARTGALTVFNQVSLEDYLYGVVPRESPDSWGNLGGGWGMQALMAQAVAARSYAVASGDRPSGARMCDTVSCQVYRGATYQPWSQARQVLDGTNTTSAIQQTAGLVRFWPGTGTSVRTEFSSSTGGWTVPGTFPAVPDAGDAISLNPNHVWRATFTAGEIASRLGISGVRSVTVTARNGLGDWGGRVTQVAVVDGAGTQRLYSGGDFRSKMGTDRFKSDWFAVAGSSSFEAEAVVTALYQDLLLRAPDPTGLAGWSQALMTGTSQAVLVDTLTRSREYIQLRVAKAYTEVLGRAPDPQGAEGWLVAIQAGQATVDDVQRRFYDSTEYFTASGGTTEGYVRRLYTTMLRREASPAEVTDWTNLMAARGRAYVVDAIWFSLEAAKVRAGDYYQVFLGRAPDPDGQTAWAQVLLQHGEGAVRNGIAGSLEYKARAIARFS